MGELAMTVVQASAVMVAAMVVVVLVTAALERRTPPPGSRTRRTAPRRRPAGQSERPVGASWRTLAGVGAEHARVSVDLTDPTTAFAPPPVQFPAPAPDGADVPDGPATELVPVVVMQGWAEDPPAAEHGPAEHGAPAHDDAAHGTAAETPSTVFVVGVDALDGAVLALGEAGADRDLAGVLFAAYVAGGFPECARVTGWVTAAGTPPSAPELLRGDRLRGRPNRVRELLGCGDEGRNWVTLDPATDIARGLRQKRATDPVLRGLLWWWLAATDERARVHPAAVVELGEALRAVLDHVEANPLAGTVAALCELAACAQAEHAGLRVEAMSASALEVRRLRTDAAPDTATVVT